MKNIFLLPVMIALAGLFSCNNPSQPTVSCNANNKADEMKARYTILNDCYIGFRQHEDDDRPGLAAGAC